MEDVFDAPRAEPMTAAEFAELGAGDWDRATLRVTPALRLLKLRYPANDFMNASRRGERPRVPRPRATFAIVFRRGFLVMRRDQEPEQFRLLEALVAGRPLAVGRARVHPWPRRQRRSRRQAPRPLVRGMGGRAAVRALEGDRHFQTKVTVTPE